MRGVSWPDEKKRRFSSNLYHFNTVCFFRSIPSNLLICDRSPQTGGKGSTLPPHFGRSVWAHFNNSTDLGFQSPVHLTRPVDLLISERLLYFLAPITQRKLTRLRCLSESRSQDKGGCGLIGFLTWPGVFDLRIPSLYKNTSPYSGRIWNRGYS